MSRASLFSIQPNSFLAAKLNLDKCCNICKGPFSLYIVYLDRWLTKCCFQLTDYQMLCKYKPFHETVTLKFMKL